MTRQKRFFYFKKPQKIPAWSCHNVCDGLAFLLDNIFIRFGTKLYRQVVGIPMGTNCAPLVADLFLFCYERDFMMSLSDDKQADIIDAFNTTARFLDDILNINNVYLDTIRVYESFPGFTGQPVWWTGKICLTYQDFTRPTSYENKQQKKKEFLSLNVI